MDTTRDAEVPFELGRREGRDEGPRRAVDVDRDGVAGLCLVLVEERGHLLHRLVVSGVGTSKDDVDTNGVLIDELHGLFGVKPIMALLGDRHKARLHVEVTSELLERDLRIRAHDDVGAGLVDALAGGLALLLPDALHREASELNGLGGASRGGTDGLAALGRMP